jgi:hypothetical protein
MKETGMYRRLTFPSTMFTQNTNDIGNILLHRCSEATSISGLVLSTLIATYAPMEEHTKCTQETVRGNLNSSFCPIKTKGGTSASRVYVSQKKKEEEKVKIFGSIGKKESAGFRDEREEL